MERIGDMSDNVTTVSSPEETGLQGNSKLCINVEYNTAVPDFATSKEDMAPRPQGESEYEVTYDTI